MLVAFVLIGVMAFAAPAFAGTRFKTNIPIDGTDMVKNMPVPKQASGDFLNSTDPVPSDFTHEYPDGSVRTADMVLKLYDMSSETTAHAGPHWVPFWLESSAGTHSDIYVAWDDLKAPLESVQQAQDITRADIDYMSDMFDSRIWASDVFHFGNYNARPAGTDAGKRAGIFIYNIRDDAYWTSYRYYIAGYFSSGLNDELDINAIFIDSYDWANRTRGTSARPYLYEGTIAHEFQHLIHNDVDNGEDSFIDEGMADLAEQFIFGPTTTSSHIGDYLYYHRDSLLDWKGELFDYGNSVLWQDYLWEQMGGDEIGPSNPADPLEGRVTDAYKNDPFADTPDKFVDEGDKFIWNQIHNPKFGLEAIADLVGGMDAVEQYHRDYTLANLLDGKVSDAKWNYRNLKLGGADSDFYTIDDGIKYYESNVGGNMPPTRKNVRRNTGVEAWGAYYRTFTGSEPGYWMGFYGKLSDGVAPFSGSTEWYGGLGNMLDRTLTRKITGVGPGSLLTFKTWFDIEEDWDYGYVEASADNGQTWHVLAQSGSALRIGTSDINGSTAWKNGPGAGGLTGSSNGWQTASFSLGGLSGDLLVRFRYVTDEASNGLGWYVDDIALGAFVDPVDSTNDWLAEPADGWAFTTGLQHNDWTADSVGIYQKAKGPLTYTVRPLTLIDKGRLYLGSPVVEGQVYVPAQFLKSGKTYSSVSNRPRDGIFTSATGNRLWISKTK